MRTSFVVMALFVLALTASVAAAEPYKVVVNAENPTAQISKATLRDYFLGKATRWPHGPAVKPVDLSEASPVREEFSEEVLGRTVAAVRSHWLTTVFAGRGTPPVQLPTDADVLATIRSSPTAIGYVSASAPLGAGVKVVSVTD